MDIVFAILVMLQIKHWLFDFVYQTDQEILYKGTYGDWRGIMHSAKHGFATVCVLIMCMVDLQWAYVIGAIEFVLHYHIDWLKMNWGCGNMKDPKFWNHLGLDQMAHQLCYVFYVWIIV